MKFKSSHRRCSVNRGVLRNFAKFTGKHLCESLRSATLLKKRLWQRCFPENFAKLLRTHLLQNTSKRLLLGCPSGSSLMRIVQIHSLNFFIVVERLRGARMPSVKIQGIKIYLEIQRYTDAIFHYQSIPR